MIVSFNDSKTEKIYHGERVKGYSNELQHIVRRKLRMINNSHSLNDLMVPPSNKLEKLKGDKKGVYSIRVNDRWRICFICRPVMLSKLN
ncbi:MAG: type II toxin-antitoxin system RelE/ParE family toxin [bacterium]